jgi:hypothetical protein
LLAQSQHLKERTVEQAGVEGPVEIVNLEIEGRPTRFNDRIIAGKDWLKTLKLEFKNLHDKSIVHLRAELEIAPTGKMEVPLRLALTFGVRPGVPGAEQAAKTLKKLAPNNTKKLSLSEETSDFLLRYMKEQEIEDIDKVKVYVEFIVFDDGGGWSKGHTMRQDTKNPGTWWVDGLWRDRPISSLKNRHGVPGGDPPPKRQYSSQTVSFQPCPQNTKKQTFNFMTIGHKFFPSRC